MSTPQRQLPSHQGTERSACMCVHGAACSSFAPGHALHLIQARLAAATPSEWIDAIVETANAQTGSVVVRSLLEGTSLALWSGAGAADCLQIGTPVAVHTRYHVLAVGSRRFNVVAD